MRTGPWHPFMQEVTNQEGLVRGSGKHNRVPIPGMALSFSQSTNINQYDPYDVLRTLVPLTIAEYKRQQFQSTWPCVMG